MGATVRKTSDGSTVPSGDASDAGRRLGRLGAQKGGRARALSLTPAERSEIARHAVLTRWAKAGHTAPRSDHRPPVEGESDRSPPRSLFHGSIALGRAVAVECHVLSDGGRVFSEAGLAAVVTGTTEPEALVRALGRTGRDPGALLLPHRVAFQVAGGMESGMSVAALAEICEVLLVARDGGRLKKKHRRLASTAESIVRTCAGRDVTALVDESTGYRLVRSMRRVQSEVQAGMADRIEWWASLFPTPFWDELTRLEDGAGTPGELPMRWGPYVVAFAYDAVEPLVRRELRKDRPDPVFTGRRADWLGAVGPTAVGGRVEEHLAVMRGCIDIDAFTSAFARVLAKRPLQAPVLPDPA